MISLSSKATGGATSLATAFLTISAVELVKTSTAETRTSMEVLGVLLPMTFMIRTLKMLVAILVATQSSSWTFVWVLHHILTLETPASLSLMMWRPPHTTFKRIKRGIVKATKATATNTNAIGMETLPSLFVFVALLGFLSFSL